MFRVEASRNNALVDIVRTTPGSQAATLRDVVSRSPSVVVLAPDTTDPALPSAVAEAKAAGVPILLIGRELPGVDESTPLVAATPPAEAARKIVEAAAADAQRDGFPASGPAVLLVNGPFDDPSRDRLEALRKAATDAGLTLLPDLRFEGFITEARAVLEPFHAEHPDLAIVLTEEDQALRAAVNYRHTLPRDRPRFLAAGFGIVDDIRKQMDFNLMAAAALRSPEKVGIRAFQAALAAARGEPVEPRILLADDLLRASGPEISGYFPADSAIPTPTPVRPDRQPR
jgi:ABC-type sugar transport system substrate-binding protein